MVMEHTKFMQIALAQAQKSAQVDEVPVGAIIVGPDGKILARAHNLTESRNTQAAHAEVLAISKAGKKMGDWRLNGCWLYVTLEPCKMCYELILLSRLDGIVFGAKSPLFGYSVSQLDRVNPPRLYKDRRSSLVVIEGVCALESAAVMKEFFKKKRG